MLGALRVINLDSPSGMGRTSLQRFVESSGCGCSMRRWRWNLDKGKRWVDKSAGMLRRRELREPKAFRGTFENPMAGHVNESEAANVNGIVPVDFSRIIVTVSMLQPCDTR